MFQVVITKEGCEPDYLKPVIDEWELRHDHLLRVLNVYTYHENCKMFMKVNDDKYVVVENDDRVTIIKVVKIDEVYRGFQNEELKRRNSRDSMKNYRVKEINGKFYPQERFFFFFWANIKLYDRVSRDWFVTSAENNCYDGEISYLIAKDVWGATNWIQPEFNTLGRAKLFIEEYKKFLENQKAKYYY